MGTQKSLSRPNFRLPFKTEILTLEIVTCKLLLLERPTLSQFFQSKFVYRLFFYMKVDHHSYRCNFCSCEKKAWKNFRLVRDSKVGSITAMITSIIYFHIILHPAVHIYGFHIFITSGYFFLIILPLPLKVNWCQRLYFFFFGLKFMLL